MKGCKQLSESEIIQMALSPVVSTSECFKSQLRNLLSKKTYITNCPPLNPVQLSSTHYLGSLPDKCKREIEKMTHQKL
jgi:hypothetical protein